MQIFWDMESCPINDEFPPDTDTEKFVARIFGNRLTAPQHYDMLLNFARQLGVADKDLLLHAAMSQSTLQHKHPVQLQNDISKIHASNVFQHHPLGNDGKRKKDEFIVDTTLKNAISRFIDTAGPGDIIMLLASA